MDVYSLSDKELLTELRNHGLDPGPILASTRSLYQRKLARLLGQESSLSFPNQDAQSLSDKELAESLEEYGHKPGPILPNTRHLYEKKLTRLIEADAPAPAAVITGQRSWDTGEHYHDSQVDTDYQGQVIMKPSREARTNPKFSARQHLERQREGPRDLLTKTSSRSESSGHSAAYSRRKIPTPVETKSEEEHTKTKPQKSSSSWLLRIIVLLVFVVIVYLVIQNMEAPFKNKVPDAINYDEV